MGGGGAGSSAGTSSPTPSAPSWCSPPSRWPTRSCCWPPSASSGFGVPSPQTDWGTMLSNGGQRRRQRLVVGDLPGRHRASCWWWWPSTSSATPCATPSRSGSSAAEPGRSGGRGAGRPSRRPRRGRPPPAEARDRRLQREVAGGQVAGTEVRQRRLLLGAEVLGPGAPGPEPAARGRVDGRGQLAPHRRLARLAPQPADLGHRDGVEQAPGVGVGRALVDLGGRARSRPACPGT